MAISCPFCAEEIKPEAVVCKHCRRDLSMVRALETEIAALKADIGALRAAAAQSPAPESAVPESRAVLTARPGAPVGAIILMIVPLLLLLLAHYVIVVRLDLDTLVLRVASIVIPMLCAIAVKPLGRQSLTFTIVAAGLLGVVAVSAMSAVVSWIDRVALLPASAREWRELVEYMASISLSFVTGALIIRAFGRRREHAARPGPLAVGATAKLHRLVDSTVTTAESLEKRAQTLQNLVNATAPALAAAGAVATGLRSWLQ